MIRPKIKKNQLDLIPQLQLASAPFKKTLLFYFKFLAHCAALEVTPKSIAKVWIADGACIWSLHTVLYWLQALAIWLSLCLLYGGRSSDQNDFGNWNLVHIYLKREHCGQKSHENGRNHKWHIQKFDSCYSFFKSHICHLDSVALL